jgi:hypothetical protein
MSMRIVSTVHKAGWEAYGHAWAQSVADHWGEADTWLYFEGFAPDGEFDIRYADIDKTERIKAFKAQYKHYKPVLWQWDIVRWSNKVFANYDALYDYGGLAVWLDCDTVTKKPITEDFIRSLLPQGQYMACFHRVGMPTETGFVIRDCSHPIHKPFMDLWVQWLESGQFKTLNQWCDASTMDATIRLTKAPTVSLSGPYEKELSPMDLAPLSQYIEHRKGNRKWAKND